jgi:uncharacterized protein YabE (DUF348 family)
VRKSAKLCLYGVVLAGVVGGTAAWATTDKAVAITVDGQTRTVHTRAGTVGGALKSAKIALASHDVVAPAVSAKISNKGKIVIRKGRLLHLTVDGKTTDVWTTATTVDEALDALGLGDGKTVSVSRSTRLPLSVTDLTLLTPKTVTIKVDGKSIRVSTTTQLAIDVVHQAGVKLGRWDRLSVKGASTVSNNQVIVVSRVKYANVAETQPIPYSTSSTPDPTALEGTTQVITAGKAGSKTVTYQVVYINGKLAGKRILVTKVLSNPVTQVQKVGSKKAPVAATPPANNSGGGGGDPVPAGEAQQIAAKLVAAHGWGSGEFGCLVSLWNRESGWNVHASNGGSGAYGIPQALPGSKMASAGPDWQDNATTQITWGLGYISGRYGTPCGAWGHSQATGWY